MAKPKIRFNGYTEDWEQRKLGDVFEQTSNLVNPKEDEIELWSLTVEDGLTKKSDRYNREFLVKKDDNFKEVRPGDIVYNPMNMTLGAVGYNGMAKSVAVSGYYTTMVAKENYDTYYINTWLKSPQAIRLYRTYATGSLIEKQRVQFPTLSVIPVAFPKYEEQTKIGNYFHFLDNLITLHQRKCEQTKTLKKYMLQKMFPQDGEKVPQIRFEGFTEDWEQRKLGEVCSRVQGNDGRMDLPTLTISAANGWMNQEDRFSGNIAGKEQKNYTLLHKGELSYNHGNSKLAKYGTVFSLQSYKEALVPRVYHSFKVEEGSPDFLEYYFATKLPDRELGKLISSGARMDGLLNIGYNEFMGIQMLFPSVEEQKQISNYFRSLDHLITLHQRKCDELKEVKKFMLQNMFV